MKSPSTASTITVGATLALFAFISLAHAQEGPQVTFSTPSLNFGQVSLGESQVLEVFARNTGNATLSISSAPITGGFLSESTDAECLQVANFAPGAGCDFGALFSPKTPGLHTGTLSLI